MLALRRLAVVLLCSGAAACGRSVAETGDTAQPASGASGPNTASFTVASTLFLDGGTNGQSFSLAASFTQGSTCESSTIDGCTVSSCSAPAAGATAPNVGTVSLLGPGATLATLEPQSDGLYLTQTLFGSAPWTTSGSSVTFIWANFPGDAAGPGGSVTVATPAYVTLTSGSAFSSVPATVVRAAGLTASWTNDSQAAASEEVMVGVSSGSTSIDCGFAGAGGSGVIAPSTLAYLAPGTGTFNIHSKQYATQSLTGPNGVQWSFAFNVDAYAQTSYGVATGSVSIQ